MFVSRWLRSWRTPLAVAGMGIVGFALGTWNQKPTAIAAQPQAGPVVPVGGTQASDYPQRVVAQIYGNELITREDLGEYLIARQGYQKVELLVNRRIIEHACKEKNITATDAEVEASLNDDLERMKIDRATFVKEILKKRGQTLYELKEDVIRPGLMLKKMCQGDIKVEDAELKQVFEERYGQKVQCRMILWKENELRIAQQVWDTIRKSEAAFDEVASKQATPSLASVGGKIPPIGHAASASEGINIVEKIAFRLKPGDVSEIFAIKEIQALAVLRCDKLLPPTEGVTFEKVRDQLYKEAFDQKVTKAIPQLFAKLREEAKPMIHMPHVSANPTVIRTQEEQDKYFKEDAKPTAPLPTGK